MKSNKEVVMFKHLLLCLLLWLGLGATTLASKPVLFLLDEYQPQRLNFTDNRLWLMSEKLDGVRAYWDGEQLVTRNGNRLAAPDWFLAALPPFALDGELWLERGHFEETLSIVRQQVPHEGWRRISYQIFEVPAQPGGLLARLQVLADFLAQQPADFIQIIAQQRVLSDDVLQKKFREIVAAGGEGLVVRDGAIPYSTGRLATAFKLKDRLDSECTVRGYRPGKGKYQGMVGSLMCELESGVTIRLGSGLRDSDRAQPPAIGAIVTFQYSGLTAYGKPRHPVYLRVREAL